MWSDLAATLRELEAADRLRELRVYRKEGVHLIDSQGNRLVNFGANDYLGLADAVGESLQRTTASGATASGLVCGWTDRHQLLASRIAELESTESAVIFPSGFAACAGTVATLARQSDFILSDELNHASLIDGCRLSKANRWVYPHRDVAAIHKWMLAHRNQYRRVWIVTESIFSMDGHVAPLEAICDLADQFDATLIVDEAHATGVLGDSGSGASEALGVKDRIPIRIGTLSKALGGQGGFVACPDIVARFLVNHCRPLIYSTALSLPAVETALTALQCVADQPALRQRVRALSQHIRQSLCLPLTAIESEVPIIPILIGSDTDALHAAERLRRLGMFVPAIRPPTVPAGQSRLRVSLSAAHRDDMVKQLIQGLRSL